MFEICCKNKGNFKYFLIKLAPLTKWVLKRKIYMICYRLKYNALAMFWEKLPQDHRLKRERDKVCTQEKPKAGWSILTLFCWMYFACTLLLCWPIWPGMVVFCPMETESIWIRLWSIRWWIFWFWLQTERWRMFWSGASTRSWNGQSGMWFWLRY